MCEVSGTGSWAIGLAPVAHDAALLTLEIQATRRLYNIALSLTSTHLCSTRELEIEMWTSDGVPMSIWPPWDTRA